MSEWSGVMILTMVVIFPFSCSLAGLILISTVVCFLLPPFRYHLTLTHISIFITYFGYIPSCSLARLILISTVVCFPHPPSPFIMLILLYWSSSLFVLYSLSCVWVVYHHTRTYFSLLPYHLFHRTCTFVLYPLTLVHG